MLFKIVSSPTNLVVKSTGGNTKYKKKYKTQKQTWLFRASEARFTEGLEVSFSILITTWVREIIRTTTYCQIKQLPIGQLQQNIMKAILSRNATVCCFFVSLGTKALVSPSILDIWAKSENYFINHIFSTIVFVL